MTTVVPVRATDGQLLTAIGRDDVAAFEELFKRYASRAIGVAASLSRDRAEAEDCVQDAFISIWRNRTSYVEGRGSPAGWVLGITRNRAIDQGRRRRSMREFSEAPQVVEDLAAADEAPERAELREQAEHVGDLLKQLPDLQREVIALAFYGQLTHREIARHLELPEGTIKGRIRLGLAKLRAVVVVEE